EVHQPGCLAHRAVLLLRVGHDRRRPVAEQVHPVVRQRLQARVERGFLAHGASSRSATATAAGRSSASSTSSDSSRSSSAPWCPEVLIASSYIVTSFGQATTK